MKIAQLFRFPIKGLPGEAIDAGAVSVGGGIRGDRSIAFTNGTVEVLDGQWGSCHSFTILKNNKSLQKWSVESNPPFITVAAPDQVNASSLTFDSSTPDGVAELGAYLSAHLPTQGAIERRAVSMPKGMFDSQRSGISIINPRTVERLSVAGQIEMDPRRYRGNILVEGLPAFAEFGLIGKVIRIGEARIAITKSIERCSATSVNPETTEVDINGPRLLATHFGHLHCGIYGTVLEPGTLEVGDEIKIEMPSEDISNLVPAKRSPRYATVQKTTKVSSDLVEITLSDTFGWFKERDEAGTYLRVHFSDPAWRNYTVTAVDEQNVTIAVRIQGAVSAKLSQLEPGEQLLISGPYGSVTAAKVLRERTALVSAGIGITPVLGLLRDHEAAAQVQDLRLVHVERGAPNALFSEARALAGRGNAAPTVQYFDSTVARPNPEDIARVVAGCDSVVICGPQSFTQMAQEICRAEGIEPQNIHCEAFASPHKDFSELFQDFANAEINCFDSGKHFEWQPEQGVLLDALQAQGIDAPSSCQAGSCGQCAVKLLKGSVSYPMEPSATIPDGHVLTCVAVPRENVELDI